MHSRGATTYVGLCMLLTLGLGSAYMRYVPRWNNPDEPAHWNFIVYVARTGQLPILQPGDYPEQTLEVLKSLHFPGDRSIETIRYESHQPPLYYVIGAALYRLSAPISPDGALYLIKIMSVLAAVALVWVTYRIGCVVAIDSHWIAAAAAGLVALLPMNLNMAAAVNNDTLGNLLLAMVVLLCLHSLQTGLDRRHGTRLGMVMGLALLTKVTAFVALPLVAVASVLAAPMARGTARRHLVGVATTFLVSLVVAGWWPVRNVLVYGGGDFLGLARNREVATQPLTGPLTTEAVRRWASITFDSFWGQFGWMGIPLDGRVYRVLLLATVLAVAGLVVRGLRHRSPEAAPVAWPSMILVATWLALVVGDDIWYNLTFIQAQGRYLFPALPAFGLLFAGGLLTFLRPRAAWVGACGIAGSLTLLNVSILWSVLRPYFHT